MQKNNGELGLIDIFLVIGEWITKGVKTLVHYVLYLFFFGMKRWKIFVIAAGIIGIYSFFSYRTQDKQYAASMIVRSNATEAGSMKKYFDGYSSLLANGLLDEGKVSQISGLSEVERESVISMNTHFCIDTDRDGILDEIDMSDKLLSSDEHLDSLHLCVKVCFEDIDVLPALKVSLLNYINNVSHIHELNKTRLTQLQGRKEFINKELDLLDTLQKVAYSSDDISKSLRASGNHVVVDNRKILIYEDKEILLEESDLIQTEIEVFSAPVTVIDDFVVSTATINSFIHILKSNMIKGLALIYLLLFVYFVYNNVKGQYLIETKK